MNRAIRGRCRSWAATCGPTNRPAAKLELRATVACLLFFGACGSEPPAEEAFRIEPLRPVEELRAVALEAEPPLQPEGLLEPDLVELVALEPTIRLDIRYATVNNFMGARFYAAPRAFLQRPAAEALVRVHRELGEQGLGLLVFDGYRPWYVTKMFWDATPAHQRDYVADPARGSRHNRGAAVDLTLCDLESGEALPMPSGYDEFSERAHPDYSGGTADETANRELLRSVMEAEGFSVYQFEWWHFDYKDAERYPLLNLPLDKLPAAMSGE